MAKPRFPIERLDVALRHTGRGVMPRPVLQSWFSQTGV
jgi:hypothetical protein